MKVIFHQIIITINKNILNSNLKIYVKVKENYFFKVKVKMLLKNNKTYQNFEKVKEINSFILKIMKKLSKCIQKQFNKICLKVFYFQIGPNVLKCLTII